MRILQFADLWLKRLENFFMYGAAAATAGIMIVVVADVTMRYFLNAPLIWAYDLISNYFMVAAFFLAISATLRRNEHVRVDLLIRRLSSRARSTLAFLAYIPAAIFFAIVLREGFIRTWKAWISDDVVGGMVPWPVWLSEIFVPIGSGLIFARILHIIITQAIEAFLAEKDKASPSSEAGGNFKVASK